MSCEGCEGCEGCEEGAYVIDALAKLLAEIAIIVNGLPPSNISWSYHDLPEKVRALKQAQQPAAAVPAYYQLGETIYTPPSEEVRFCYSRGQPNNINASRLGEACRRAAEKPGGDYIDGGLSLLKELEARGYGVFRFAKSAHEPAQQPAAAVPEGYALVPVEPTDAMLEAAEHDYNTLHTYGDWDERYRIVWAAMLAAAARKGE